MVYPDSIYAHTLMILLGAILLSVILGVIGLILKRRGRLTTFGAMFGWGLLTMLPLVLGLFAYVADPHDRSPAERSDGPHGDVL